MFDLIQHFFSRTIKTPRLPNPPLTTVEEWTRLEERQQEVRARLELLRIESEMPGLSRFRKEVENK
ncbi:MAG: hypothetical protein M3440_14870 [Chloroflexota bacterium]|nr:hypothetical protein [Chloroflexota bacterium]